VVYEKNAAIAQPV